MRYFIVTLDSFNSEGPYSIYYNSIDGGTIANYINTTTPTENITPYELLDGVTIQIPDNATKIIIYDTSLCQEYQEIQISNSGETYNSFCVTIIGNPFTQGMSPEITKILFEYTGDKENDKPVYSDSGSTYFVTWDGNKWVLEGFDIPNSIIVSNNFTDTPYNAWEINGELGSFYTIYSSLDECSGNNPPNIRINSFPPSCSSLSNGQITIQVLGGTPPFSYSLDNILFVNDGNSHTFFGLSQGGYNVFVQDATDVYVNYVDLTSPIQQQTFTALFNNLSPQQGLNFVSCNNDLALYNVNGSISFYPSLPANVTSLNSILKVDVEFSFDNPGTAGIGPFSITASNGNNSYTLTQYVTTPLNSGGIVCGNPNYLTYAGMSGYSTPIPYIQNNGAITFGVNFYLDMTNCQIDSKFNCQTNARIRVKAYLDNIGNANTTSCTKYASRTYDSGIVTINCLNKRC